MAGELPNCSVCGACQSASSRIRADECLIDLNRAFIWAAAHLGHRTALHRFPNPVKHEPSSLLPDTDHPAQLVTGDAVLAVGDRPKCRHPFVERDRRVLHNRADFDRELFLAWIAVPDAARLDERVVRLTAPWAGNFPAKPAHLHGIFKATLRVTEVNYCFLKCAWFSHRFNGMPKVFVCQAGYCRNQQWPNDGQRHSWYGRRGTRITGLRPVVSRRVSRRFDTTQRSGLQVL